MRAVVKFVFAAVLAVLLLCAPVGACADSLQTAGAPSHPCCPKKPAPLPEDCARPGCVYMDTHVVSDVSAPVAELTPAVLAERPGRAWVPVVTLAPLAPRQRVVLFHQLLI